jgi:hypothetical protein
MQETGKRDGLPGFAEAATSASHASSCLRAELTKLDGLTHSRGVEHASAVGINLDIVNSVTYKCEKNTFVG